MQDTVKKFWIYCMVVDKKNNVVELNAMELLANNKETVSKSTEVMSDDELVASGYQLTDTGWVKS